MAARNCAKLDVFVKKLTPVKTEPHINYSYLKILDLAKSLTTCRRLPRTTIRGSRNKIRLFDFFRD